MPKLITPPNQSNTLTGEEKFVEQVYAKPAHLHKLCGIGRSTVYKLLKEYDEDDKGVKELYVSLSPTLTLVDIQKFKQYLNQRHKKWM
ncbi:MULTISPECIES: helix-turn-helix domain-containing protein [unclassified Mammaliicoccus]|uniref:helix-turn-helix domain-containing protein n=1 Tax=unclassified Mammaliicoccus TaxID=2803851 RepID=UPI001EFAEE95|nr:MULTISPECIES: helix-turn-helix domain-containing protein [unclassified Mammaliicoccus]